MKVRNGKLSAAEAARIISYNLGRERHVVKHNGRWYSVADPEKGCEGKGASSPGLVVLDLHQILGRLKIPPAASPPERPKRQSSRNGQWALVRKQGEKEEIVVTGSRGKCWVASRKLGVMHLSQKVWTEVDGRQYQLRRVENSGADQGKFAP